MAPADPCYIWRLSQAEHGGEYALYWQGMAGEAMFDEHVGVIYERQGVIAWGKCDA